MPEDISQAADLDRLIGQRSEAIEDARALPLVAVCLLALSVGIIGGLGAVLFRALIAFVHNLLFLGHISIFYDSSIFTAPPPWGWLVILVPVIGGLGVTFIVTNFAPEAKGHGVPEVMDAIYYNRGIIRPVVAVAKSLASALSIGSGAAVGREGPIIQIGSAFGSTLGQWIRMSMGQRVILVAAGAGAGIAATFNTPIGGVLFATELMMPEISVNTFLPVAIATGTATFIGRLFFGDTPAFNVPTQLSALPTEWKSVVILIAYLALGALVGVAAALFVRGLHAVEDLFDKIPGNYLRHIIGTLLVGILIYALLRWGGHYYVEGVGYATIQATLTNQLGGAWFLLLLYGCKLLATSLSSGIRLIRRHLLALAVHGCDARRRIRWTCAYTAAWHSGEHTGLRHGWHGNDGRCRYRRGHDLGRDGLRDDARLQHCAADGVGGRDRSRRASFAVA